jgi:hypothetical protein
METFLIEWKKGNQNRLTPITSKSSKSLLKDIERIEKRGNKRYGVTMGFKAKGVYQFIDRQKKQAKIKLLT